MHRPIVWGAQAYQRGPTITQVLNLELKYELEMESNSNMKLEYGFKSLHAHAGLGHACRG
jgi:hypothetical protein